MRINKLFLRWIAVFGMVMAFAVSGWSDGGSNDSCNGEQISELHGISSTTSRNETGSVNGTTDTNDYYYFTPAASGSLSIDYTSTSLTRFYVSTVDCGDSEKVSVNNITSYSTGATSIAVSAGETVYIRVNRRSGSPTYSINMTYTILQTPPLIATIPDQAIKLGNSFSSVDLDNYVTATNGDAVTLSVSSLPAGLSYNSTTHVISGTPTTLGLTTVTVTATDNDGSAQKSFMIYVYNDNNDYTTNNLRTFAPYRQDNIYGDIQVIGNSMKVVSGGSCAPASTNNNNLNIAEADLDNDSSTYNSTSATLKLPRGVKSSDILYAMLLWQGRITWNTAQIPLGKVVKIKPYGYGSYVTRETNSSKFNWYTTNYYEYQGETDVTDLIKTSIDNVSSSVINSTGYSQPVWVANVFSNLNGSNSNGFGAWAMVVVYQDSNATFKSITTYDGYDRIASTTGSNNKQAVLNGFLTPKTGVVNSKFLLFAGEGDISLADSASLTDINGNTVSMGSNVFQSVEDIDGVNVTSRNPSCQNTIGADIRTFTVGTNGSIPAISNNQTTTTITMSSGGDEYFPGMFAFSTELYMPQLCYDYSFKQDNQYLKAVNDGSNGILPLLTGTISDSPLEVAIYVRNKEADIKVEGVSFYTDLNTTVFNYVPSSTATTNVNASGYTTRSDSFGSCAYDSTSTSTVACNDGHNVRIGLGNGATGYGQTTAGDLGSQEFVYAKFEIQPTFSGIRDVNESLGLKLDYYIQPDVNAPPSVRNYTFGQHINLCPPSSGYNPVWGTFNVVDHYASTLSGLPVNNLRTQVARKPFAVDVATYEKDTTTGKYTKVPTIDMNTTVLVEVIDNDAFHDVNASCANPGSAITEPIYVRVDHTSTDMTIDIPVQSLSYHNFAVKNAAYRVWYFDQNQSLINWSAATSDTTRRKLTNISGLYRSTYHTVCSTACASPTSTTCFNCIKTNYARPLCSRDNFAVRPESYDLRIYDVNQTLPKNSTLKDATKIDLSNQYQYAPAYTSSIGRMNLAAGYNYRYDMNATGNDANLTKVPGYTRYFNGANPEYNATMIWNPRFGKTTSGCNDTSSKNLTFYVANGQMRNSEQNQTQVGDYQLNVIDPSWTAVDWKSSLLAHHTDGFEATKEDCYSSSDSTTSASGKIGCLTTSAHSGGGYVYKDHLLTLKPAKFDVSSFVHGVGITPLVIAEGGSGFVYNSDLSVANDMVMSVRSSGPLKAVGYGGETLSNFVKDCYATDLNLSISHDVNSTKPFSGRMTVAETNGTQIFDSLKFSAKNRALQVIEDTYFHKKNNGQTVPTMRLNFDRNSTTYVLPQDVHYGDLNVSCSEPSDCNISAKSNTTPNTAAGTDNMDFDVTHVYGRVVPRDARATLGAPFNALAYYEVYKKDNLLGTGLTPDQFDGNWYVNKLHTDANYGDANVTVVIPLVGASLPTHTLSTNGMETYQFPAFTIKNTYRAHINTEGWLWYGDLNALMYGDPANPANLDCLTHPCFNITMGRIYGNTGSAKTESEGNKANKKTTSTGWSTTSEYAPAAR